LIDKTADRHLYVDGLCPPDEGIFMTAMFFVDAVYGVVLAAQQP
jgi:hypothetical protein